jgi:hypothetical protein
MNEYHKIQSIYRKDWCFGLAFRSAAETGKESSQKLKQKILKTPVCPARAERKSNQVEMKDQKRGLAHE